MKDNLYMIKDNPKIIHNLTGEKSNVRQQVMQRRADDGNISERVEYVR